MTGWLKLKLDVADDSYDMYRVGCDQDYFFSCVNNEEKARNLPRILSTWRTAFLYALNGNEILDIPGTNISTSIFCGQDNQIIPHLTSKNLSYVQRVTKIGSYSKQSDTFEFFLSDLLNYPEIFAVYNCDHMEIDQFGNDYRNNSCIFHYIKLLIRPMLEGKSGTPSQKYLGEYCEYIRGNHCNVLKLLDKFNDYCYEIFFYRSEQDISRVPMLCAAYHINSVLYATIISGFAQYTDGRHDVSLNEMLNKLIWQYDELDKMKKRRRNMYAITLI
ncbi:MAG: hypothetical protein LBI69_02955 [Puniceicoccales bacterium]|nr:hypothetical protein [Puniceicoccales bacterium]